MEKREKRLLGRLLLFFLVTPAAGQPVLSIQVANGQNIRIFWSSTADSFSLEQTRTLLNAAAWQTVGTAPVLQDNSFVLTLPFSEAAQFFRLQQSPSLTSIASTSPASGETGVAVTRETIIHFTSPLSSNTVLTAANFFAGFGGRKLLSRSELSSDRLTATLFYLEPLPGSARLYVVFDGTGIKDQREQLIDADGDGSAGGSLVSGFETLNLTPLSGTAVIGTVFASELAPGPDTGTNAVNKPLAGVTITVDGMEQTLRATTDANGNFTLSPAPPGRFFVHIDGRTVVNDAGGIHYPAKSYYPYVGKAWDAVAGKTNNLAGGTGTIFLPLITVGTLQPVSMTSDTVISFPDSVLAKNPALAGVSITVPANSLYSDNGARGGKVGIAPVPPDRLPGPLPPGLELPIVITVQTDGPLNFDKPVPICFPNLPDPVLKTPLPAGSEQALITFNHKKGIWEAVGSMTVSADGKFICTDPGVGILQPGWVGCSPKPKGPPPCRGLCCPGLVPELCRQPCKGKETLEECKNKCFQQWSHGCDVEAWSAFYKCIEIAENDSDMRKCERLLDALQKPSCKRGYSKCVLKCAECDHPARWTAFAQQPSDDLANQIVAQLEEIAALLKPFLALGSEIPSEVQVRVRELVAQSDALGNGNAGLFLDQYSLVLEEQLASFEAEIGEETGDAPDYPVLYAAQIARPVGALTLRGETGPFGQYSLFIPRDGQLTYVTFYDPRTKQIGTIFPRLRPEAPYSLPRFNLVAIDDTFLDTDHDRLPDAVEFVYGTDELNPDSDGDGILDGAEVDQGTNPLDGVPVRTGIIGTAKTPGIAVDVAASNDLLAVAEGADGVSIFNIQDGLNPVLVAHVDTPGTAQAVAISGNLIVVADREQGLAIIDISNPATARIVHQIRTISDAQAVAVAGNVAYVAYFTGLDQRQGAVGAVDLVKGFVFDNINLPFFDFFYDLAVSGEELYLLTGVSLQIYSTRNNRLELLARLTVSGAPSRLFVGGGFAYISHFSGYTVVDVHNPAAPVIVGSPSPGQIRIGDLMDNGSGSLLAATVTPSGKFAVSIYDSSQPTDVTKYLTSFTTPGDARAVTIYNGLAYDADFTAGIQVINYLAYDNQGKAPTITLSTSGPNGAAEAGSPLIVTASARDDVQVRNVEFYVDGVKTFTDGNFPFEFRFNAPALTLTKTNLTLRARAVDTGGNATWSDDLIITLVPDKTPPRVLATAPLGGAKLLTNLFAWFSEPMNPATLNPASFRLIAAGADGLLGTADDLPVSGGVVSYSVQESRAFLDFAMPIPNGLYRAVITTSATDQGGNAIEAEYTWPLRVADGVFWSRNTDGFWADGLNWSTGVVPGPADNVFIESIPGVTITIPSGVISTFNSLLVGERVLLNGGTLKGGTVTQNGAGKLIFTGNVMNTLDGVSVVGDLGLTNTSARAVIRNGLTLTGSVILGDAAAITFAGDQTLGSGEVAFAGFSCQLGIEGSATLTLGPAVVVRGKSGVIGQGVFATSGTKKLVNQGRISADVAGGQISLAPNEFENAGTIEVKNGGSVTFPDREWRSTGQINASGGGTLNLTAKWHNLGTINVNEATANLGGSFTLADLGTLNRTGGNINLTGVLDLGGGTLTLDASTGPWRMEAGTLGGGTVRQVGDAKLSFSINLNTLDGIHIEGDLDLTSTSARAVIRNGLTLTGSVMLGGGISFAGDQTFDSSRIIFGNFGAVGIEGTTTLTLGPAMVVRGKFGNIGQGMFATGGTKKLVNQGLISADVAGANLTLLPTSFENTGTLRADGAGASLVVLAKPFTNSGKIEELNGGKVLINP